jgi:hypothetical protein
VKSVERGEEVDLGVVGGILAVEGEVVVGRIGRSSAMMSTWGCQ